MPFYWACLLSKRNKIFVLLNGFIFTKSVDPSLLLLQTTGSGIALIHIMVSVTLRQRQNSGLMLSKKNHIGVQHLSENLAANLLDRK